MYLNHHFEYNKTMWKNITVFMLKIAFSCFKISAFRGKFERTDLREETFAILIFDMV